MFLHAMKFAEELEFEILQGYFQFIHVLYNLQFVDNWWFICAWKEGWWRFKNANCHHNWLEFVHMHWWDRVFPNIYPYPLNLIW